jgi:hypothetical protein
LYVTPSYGEAESLKCGCGGWDMNLKKRKAETSVQATRR